MAYNEGSSQKFPSDFHLRSR